MLNTAYVLQLLKKYKHKGVQNVERMANQSNAVSWSNTVLWKYDDECLFNNAIYYDVMKIIHSLYMKEFYCFYVEK